MARQVGEWDWAEETGGAIGRVERLRQTAQAVIAQIADRLTPDLSRRARHVDLAALAAPDTAVCRAAEALAAEICPRWLHNHNLRAWLWGRLLVPDAGVDLEAAYVATMLHDIGLTERCRAELGPKQCFTLAGARAAARLGAEQGWGEVRTRLAANAITLHLNVVVPARYGPEARLLRLGTAADVVGQGQKSVPTATRDAVLAARPRLDFKREILAAFDKDGAASPCCRGAFLFRTLRMGRLVRKTPFFNE